MSVLSTVLPVVVVVIVLLVAIAVVVSAVVAVGVVPVVVGSTVDNKVATANQHQHTMAVYMTTITTPSSPFVH